VIAGKQDIARYFEELLAKHGDHFLSLDWKSKESQLVRFTALLDIIFHGPKNDTMSILDVGCGIGHMYEFLLETKLIEKLHISYTGIDISPKMVEFAKKKFPKADFRTVDLINDKFDEKFDYVVSSGAFNIRMAPLEEHKISVHKMVSRMYELCNYGMSVNFLSNPAIFLTENDPIQDKYVYYAEEEVIPWARTLTDRYLLRRDYHPGDFTVYMLK
jgi:SAM-dependent methyltransferase